MSRAQGDTSRNHESAHARDAAPPWRLSLRSRFENILEWSPADKCILTGVIVLLFASWYMLALFYYVLHPEVAEYGNHAFVVKLFPVAFATVIGGWCLVVAVGLFLRRRRPNSRLLVWVTLHLFAVEFSLCSYLMGDQTSLFPATVLLGGATYGLVLFERPAVVSAVSTFLVVVFALVVAEQSGLVPYGPGLIEAPFKDGKLAWSWLANIGGTTFVLLFAVLGLVYHVIERWRDTTDQLARANELISRYVASQVTQQIMRGNSDALYRHDRRRLTLFFSDIKDFSDIADRIEPEDLARILNEYLAEMVAIAERYGATIDKFVGDALMIFFGAPAETDDRKGALSAVRMAHEMQECLSGLREKWSREGIEEPFQVRIGINTGVASVGNFGSKGRVDYTAIGRQVNLAARLQVNCPPGGILLSYTTWALVQGEIPCIPKGEISVKGFHVPVRVYEVSGVSSGAGNADRAAE